jgi:hypothetical protein
MKILYNTSQVSYFLPIFLLMYKWYDFGLETLNLCENVYLFCVCVCVCVCVVVMGFKLRVSHLLGRCCTTWAMLPTLFHFY